jgi:very-short-patch-repair endonuclease
MATGSELEDRFLELVIHADLPRPEVNAVVTLDDGTTYSVDFLWRDRRLAVETDGFDAHARESSFYADSRRDLRLRSARFEVLRFTWPDVSERAHEVVAAVRARL